MKRSHVLLFLAVIFCALFLLSSCDPKVEDVQYGSITGRALYSNGENHSGILLTLDKTDGLRAISASDGSKAIEGICYTKADGSYEFYNLTPGTYTIYASSNDAVEKAVSTNVYVSEGKAVSVEDLNLTATGKISGKISVDGNDTGNEGFLVFVAGTSFMAATDSTGKYTITGIPAGTDYPVIASKGSYTVSLGTCSVNALGTSSMQAVSVSSDDILSGNNSIIWKGSYADSSALSNPKRNWAYYNTTDGCSYIYDGSEWMLLASKGEQGIQGEKGETGEQGIQGEKGDPGAQGEKGETGSNGLNGLSITWKGAFESDPENPQLYWAYHNTTDGCSYLYDGSFWVLLAEKGDQGVQGIQGEQGPQGEQGIQGATGATGTTGATGASGVSIVWLGSFSEAPESPIAMNTYYNTTDGCSYIYDGTQWTTLAAKGDKGDQGEQGIQGPQGEQGIQGATGATGASGVSIVWLGSFSEAPERHDAMNSYYNTTDGCSYIYDGTQWTTLAAKGDKGEQGIQGPQGEQGHSVVVDLGYPCTCFEDGLSDGAHCVICGEILVEQTVIPATGHTFSESWTVDETYHWHVATCEHIEETNNKSEHNWDEGIVSTAASCESSGLITYTCTVCGKEKTEIIPATGHSYSDEWRFNDTYHWHVAICEHSYEKADVAGHTWDDGIVTIVPTCIDKGTILFTCIVCGETKSESLDSLGHSSGGDHLCVRCGKFVPFVGPTGGYVFYDCDTDNNSGNGDGLISANCGWRYLEAAPSDLKIIDGLPTIDSAIDPGIFVFGLFRNTDDGSNLYSNWTTTYNAIDCTRTALGTGKANTQLLVQAMGNETYSSFSGSDKTADYAARLCDILSYSVDGVIYDDWFLPSKDELNMMYTNLKQEGLGGFIFQYGTSYWSSSEMDINALNVYIQKFGSGVTDSGRDSKKYVRPIRAFLAL